MSRFVTRAPRAAFAIALATTVTVTGVGAAHATSAPAARQPATHVGGAVSRSLGSAPASGESSVTLQLAPQSKSGLIALGKIRHLSLAARRAALENVAPAPSTVSTATAYLTSAGLTVSSSTPFSVTANGASSTIQRLFPKSVSSDGALVHPMTSLSASASPLKVPTALSGVVTSVVGGASTKPIAHPLLTSGFSASDSSAMTATPHVGSNDITGASARALYDVPAAATTNDGEGITIATLQLSGWDASNLSTYAAHYGMANPVASGQYQAYSVDGSSPTAVDGQGGDVEVALDQETLLTTAPKAQQAAFFAPNSVQGFVDGIESVAYEALTNENDLISALSVSWGACEPVWGATPTEAQLDMQSVDDAILDAESVGVTVFAASGDSGAYGCSTVSDPDYNLEVDYPASDPNVVAVGGLLTLSSAPGQEVWWEPTGNTGPSQYLGQGTGGGESVFWAQPSWQSGLIAGSTTRLVPDIALDGAPYSGLDVRAQGQWMDSIGGTSLSAPLAAATFTDDQIADGAAESYGIGNIAPNLYAAPSAGFNDVVVGVNGLASSATNPPPVGYAATAGYDLASGLGSPKWAALDSAFLGAPQISVAGKTVTQTLPVTLPLAITIPQGMQFTTYKYGLGLSSVPTSCNPSGSTATLPTSLTFNSYQETYFWIVGYEPNGLCFLNAAPVNVVNGNVNDLITRDSSGKLWLYPGNGLGQFSSRTLIGSGWNVFTAIIGVGDFNGDGHPDLVTRDTSGRLWMYPGNGSGGFKSRVLIGTGWNVMSAIVSVGDFNGDGHNDFVTRDTSGRLWLYPGNGGGYFKTHVLIGVGWNSMNAIVGVGDFNGDHHADFVTRDTSGRLWLYPGNGGGAFKTHVEIGSGWSGYTSIVGPGDFNGDAHTDLLARDSSGGLWLDEGNGAGGIHARLKIGTGWNVFTSIVGVGNWKS